MNIETIERTLYTAEELREHDLAGFNNAHQWYAETVLNDLDFLDLGTVMALVVADEIGEPQAQNYGSGDYPGIPGVTVKGWDLYRMTLSFSGMLDPDDAPKLPWPKDCDAAKVHEGDGIEPLEEGSNYWPCDYMREDVRLFVDAWETAVSKAIAAGAAELDYQTSEQMFMDMAEANDYWFTEEGVLA